MIFSFIRKILENSVVFCFISHFMVNKKLLVFLGGDDVKSAQSKTVFLFILTCSHHHPSESFYFIAQCLFCFKSLLAPPSLSNARLMSGAPPRADLGWGPSNTEEGGADTPPALVLRGKCCWWLGDPLISLSLAFCLACRLHEVLQRTGWRPLIRPEVGDQLSCASVCQLWEAILVRQRPGPPRLPGYHSILETRPKLSGLKQPQPDHNIHRGDFFNESASWWWKIKW